MGNYLFLKLILAITLLSASTSLGPQFQKIAAKSKGRVGAAVLLIEAGETSGIHLHERFPMQSVFKLPVAMTVLHDVDQGKISLEQKIAIKKSDFVAPGQGSQIRDAHPEGNFELSVRELLRAMMDVSDGTACDVLLRLAGGPGSVTQYIHSLGVKEITVAISQKEMTPQSRHRNWATPKGMLELLRVLQQGTVLSPTSRELLLRLMAESRTGPGRIKGLLPPGTIVSHKTGSSGTTNGFTSATNDVGIINLPNGKHLAIAVFVYQTTTTEAASEHTIAEIARAAWDFYTGK
jgi:beta-lactamase class A